MQNVSAGRVGGQISDGVATGTHGCASDEKNRLDPWLMDDVQKQADGDHSGERRDDGTG